MKKNSYKLITNELSSLVSDLYKKIERMTEMNIDIYEKIMEVSNK